MAPPDPVVGREALVRQLAQGAVGGRSFALCGGPKLGRTTTLTQLCDALRVRWRVRRQADKVVPVLVDAGTARAEARRRRRGLTDRWFVRALWRAVEAAVLAPHTVGRDVPPRPPPLELLSGDDPWAAFRASAAALWESLRNTTGWCQQVLVVDNGDLLAAPDAASLAVALAGMVRTDAPWAPVAVVVAGGWPLRAALAVPRAPLRLLRPVTLGVLHADAAEALVGKGPCPLVAPARQHLLSLCGAHPYVLQRLLAEMATRGSEGNASIEEAVQRAQQDLTDLCESILAELGPLVDETGELSPAHALMGLLIEAGGDVALGAAERHLNVGPLRAHADRLSLLGVAERVLHGDLPHLRAGFRLWNHWYAQRRAQR